MATKKAPAKPAKKTAKKTAKKAAAPKAPKLPRVEANGVTRPKEGTKTGRVWDIADEISKKNGTPATRAEVLEVGEAEGINDATIATQYQRWRTFYGVERQARAPKAEKAPKAPKAPRKKAASA